MVLYIIIFFSLFATQNDSLILKETIALKSIVNNSNSIQIKVFNDLIVHDYNANTFYLINNNHQITNISYKNIDLKLPVPVKSPVRISDFTQINTNSLLVTETNSNSIFKINHDETSEKVIELETVPFSIISHDSYIYIITNDLKNEYLLKFNFDYEEVGRLVIGNSFFRSGVKPYDRVVTGSNFFINGDNLFLHNNDQDLYKCNLSEENSLISTCELILFTQGDKYVGEKDAFTLFYLNENKLFIKNTQTNNNRNVPSISPLYMNKIFIKNNLLFVYDNGNILIYSI